MAFRQSANDVRLDSAAVRLVHFATASVKFGQIYRLRIFTENIPASIAKPRSFIFHSGDQRLILR
jgi:hypothetical protein